MMQKCDLAKLLFAFFIFALLANSGCSRREREGRDLLEAKAASRVSKFLQLHEAQFPDRARTNLAQVFQDIGADYPADLHHAFQQAAENTGFTNSFYEKYVFIPPGVVDQQLRADIVALSAKPFYDANRQLVRAGIVRKVANETNWGVNWIIEDDVQKYFRDAQVTIPKPLPMPPPAGLALNESELRHPLRDRIEFLFRDLADDLGLGRNHWRTVLGCALMLILSIVIAVAIAFLRRGRRSVSRAWRINP